MARTTHYARTSALPAIAAALALTSTPLLAQQVPTSSSPPATTTTTTTTTTASPTTDQTPPAATESTPAATDTTDAAPATEVVKKTAVRTRTVSHASRTATAHPAATPAPVRTASTKTVTTQTATAAPAATPAPPPPAQAANSGSAVTPVVNLTSATPAKPAATNSTNATTEMLEILGGALGLIALGGIAFSAVRRRREQKAWHGDWADEPVSEHEEAVAIAPVAVEPHRNPVVHDEQPGILAPSAFAWGATAPARDETGRDSDDDRLPGETWVQRAYRGPSANNPSVSLKNRLRRAAFFDKRERDVAAGIAEPVDPDAGLPDAMTEEREHELA